MKDYKISYTGENNVTIEGKTYSGNTFKATFNIEKIIGDPLDPKEIYGPGFLETNGNEYFVTKYKRGKGFKYGKIYI